MSQRPGRTFPFSAIVGQDTLKLALTLNAVDPRVGGVLIRGHRGTAKSTAVRGLAHVLPHIEASSCAYGCDPREPARACEHCRDDDAPSSCERPVRIVELPVSATEDRLVGTLDLGAVLGKGEVAFQPGLLAAANRGILYVDEVNLLDDHLVDVLLDAAAAGVNTVEREGISVSHPARFILVGTMNPEEGELRPQLIDRFGLCVDVTACDDPADRVEIVRRRQAFEDDAPSFTTQWELADRELRERITEAQDCVADVVLPDDVVWAVAQLAVLARVEGHRADAVMARAAAAHAAMSGRTRVELLDVERVAPLVLAHRSASDVAVDSTVPALRQRLAAALHDQAAQAPEVTADTEPASPGDGQAALAFTEAEPPVAASDAPTPVIVESTTRADIVASGRRDAVVTQGGPGRTVGARPGIPRSGGELAVNATVKSAAVRAAGSPEGVSVGREDLHRKVVKRQTGASIVFCVDASGSMGVTDRLSAATEVIVEMLTQAYQRRDRVGLVTFRGRGAETVLPLTASVELAKSRLRNVASGGSTPIAAGVIEAVELLDTEKRRRPEATRWLVLVTDGRANVGAGSRLGVDEARAQLHTAVGKGVRVLVVDTAGVGGERSPARDLADSCGAEYACVREGDAAALGEAVADAV